MYDEETNRQKLLRLLPDLEGIAADCTKAGMICANRRKEIIAKYRVKVREEEGVYYVSVGGYEGTFDPMDKANNDIDVIEDSAIRRRVRLAGSAFTRNYSRWISALYLACTSRKWRVDEVDEFTFLISKDDLKLDIGGAMEEFEEYKLVSPVEYVKVGDVAKIFLEARARQAKQKAKKK